MPHIYEELSREKNPISSLTHMARRSDNGAGRQRQNVTLVCVLSEIIHHFTFCQQKYVHICKWARRRQKFTASKISSPVCCCALTYSINRSLKCGTYTCAQYFPLSPLVTVNSTPPTSTVLCTRRIFLYCVKRTRVRSIFNYIRLHIIFARMLFSRENATLDW